jgi:hypothetical protein
MANGGMPLTGTLGKRVILNQWGLVSRESGNGVKSFTFASRCPEYHVGVFRLADYNFHHQKMGGDHLVAMICQSRGHHDRQSYSMRRYLLMRACKLLGLIAVFALAATVIAADKDETFKGTIGCAKCQKWDKDLKACNISIKVKDKDGKDVLYYFDEESHKKYMGGDKNVTNFCQKTADGSVTGTVSEKDGKKYIHVTKLEEK